MYITEFWYTNIHFTMHMHQLASLMSPATTKVTNSANTQHKDITQKHQTLATGWKAIV